MGSINTEYSPEPVATRQEDQDRFWDMLPKRIRLAMAEACYEYNAEMVYNLYQTLQQEYLMPTFDAAVEVVRQLAINDFETKKKVMQEWQLPTTPTNPTTALSSGRWYSSTKRTARTAKASATIRKYRGLTSPKISAIPPEMEFDLFGTKLIPLNSPTKTG